MKRTSLLLTSFIIGIMISVPDTDAQTSTAAKLIERMIPQRSAQVAAKKAQETFENSILDAAGMAAGTPVSDNVLQIKLAQFRNSTIAEMWQQGIDNIQQLATLQEQLESALGTESILGKIYSTASAINLGRESISKAYDAYTVYTTNAKFIVDYARSLVEGGEMSIRDFSNLLESINSIGWRALSDIASIPDILREDGKTIKEREEELNKLYEKIFHRADDLEKTQVNLARAVMNKHMAQSAKDNLRSMYGEVLEYSPGKISYEETKRRAKEAIERNEAAQTSIEATSDEGKALGKYAAALGKGLGDYMNMIRAIVLVIAILLAIPALIRVNNGEAKSANAMRKLVLVTVGFLLLIEIVNTILKHFV